GAYAVDALHDARARARGHLANHLVASEEARGHAHGPGGFSTRLGLLRPSEALELERRLRLRLREPEPLQRLHEERERLPRSRRVRQSFLERAYGRLGFAVPQEERAEGDVAFPARRIAPRGRLEHARGAHDVAGDLEQARGPHGLARAFPGARSLGLLARGL